MFSGTDCGQQERANNKQEPKKPGATRLTTRQPPMFSPPGGLKVVLFLFSIEGLTHQVPKIKKKKEGETEKDQRKEKKTVHQQILVKGR